MKYIKATYLSNGLRYYRFTRSSELTISEIIAKPKLEINDLTNSTKHDNVYIVESGGYTDHIVMNIAARGGLIIKCQEWASFISAEQNKGDNLLFFDSALGVIQIFKYSKDIETQLLIKIRIQRQANKEKIISEIENLGNRFFINASTLSEIRRVDDIAYHGIGLLRLERAIEDIELVESLCEHILFDIDPDSINPKENTKSLILKVKTSLLETCEHSKTNIVTIRLADLEFRTLLNNSRCLNSIDQSIIKQYCGIRGIQLLIRFRELLNIVLSAIVLTIHELGQQYEIRILIPCVTSPEEVKYIKNRFNDIWHLLACPEDKFPVVGVMLESLQSILKLRTILRETNYFMIGTNDLTSEYFNYQRDSSIILEWYRYVGIYPMDVSTKLTREYFMFLKNIVLTVRTRADSFIGCCGRIICDPENLRTISGLNLDCYSLETSFINPMST